MRASVHRGGLRGAAFAFGDLVLALDSETPGRNVTLGPKAFLASLPARTLDLVNISAAVYLADLTVRRREEASWVRSFGLEVAVSDEGFWRKRQGTLGYLLYVLMGDNVSLRFVAGERQDAAAARRDVPSEVDSVSLLSGGLDSLGGGVVLARTGRRPWFVSHSSRCPTIDKAQRRCETALAALWSAAPRRLVVTLAPSRVRKPAQPFPEEGEREPSQRGRSLLFLAAAAGAADLAGVEELYMFENGIISTNLPLSPARLGSMSTRTAHPKVLALFADLASEVLGRRLKVVNPFQSLTKAEVVRDVLRPSLRIDDIQATVSCWQAGRTPRPCGGCVPCLVRRIAMRVAELPDEAYMIDLLDDPLAHEESDALSNLVELMMLAASFRELDDGELLVRYPQLLDGADHGAPVEAVIHLYRRFATEVFEVIPQFRRLAALLG
jgi:hypothetical protein